MDEFNPLKNSNKNPFSVPDGYFDTLPDIVMDKIEQQTKSKSRRIGITIRPLLSMAAAFLILFGIWKLVSLALPDKTQISTDATFNDSIMVFESFITDADIYNYSDSAFNSSDTLENTEIIEYLAFENIDYETEFKNYKIIKIEIPRPDNNINITFKTFKLLFSNVLELKDYSRICLIKNLNLKYYFKKLFDTETTTEKVIEGLTNNITKYLNRKEDELLSKDKVDLTLLTFYNSMISLNSKYKITNTYLYGTKVKEFIKLNNNLKSNLISIENMQLIYNDNKELIENYINSITNLLKVYYIEIFNSIRSIKSRNPESLKLDLNKNINFYFEQCRREVKYSFNDENLLEIVTLVKTTSVIDDYFCIFDSRIKYRDFNKEYFVTDETVYVDLFKIKLFNSDIRSVIVYLYTLDKEMNIYYNIMDTIESNILKIKHLSP